jgi:hypothetical protein
VQAGERLDAIEPAASRGRWIAFKILTAVFAAGSFGGLFGVAIVIAWIDNEGGGIHRVHNMGFGALFGAILTTAWLVQNWRPERKVSAFYQILDVGLAMIIAALLSTAAAVAIGGVAVLVAYGIALALHPYRSELLHPRREGFSPLLLGLTVIGAVPLIGFALTTAKYQRDGLPVDPHVSMNHWVTMSAMAIGIVLVALLSSFKFSGWRITARCAAAALFLYGLISAVYPTHAGAEGRGWAFAAMAGAIVFVVAAEWEARRPA